MTQSITDPDPISIAGSGSYDGNEDLLTIVATGEGGVTLTAIVEPSDEGFSALELVWRAFPQVATAVSEDIAEQMQEAQAAAQVGPATEAAASNA